MKTKLQPKLPVFIIALLLSLGSAPAQNGALPMTPAPRVGAQAKSAVDPFTGLPVPMVGAHATGAVDPATGLPVETPWISPDWPDPVTGTPPVPVVLTNVDFDGIPVTEVGRQLRERFANAFDMLVPTTWTAPSGESITLDQWTVNIQLHTVRASELFRAMNLSFETQNFPIRWQLMMNDSRPTVLLRVLPEIMLRANHPLDPNTGLPAGVAPPAEQPKPEVVYVGYLIGDEKSGGMSLDEIVDTLAKVNKMAGNADLAINVSRDAQLLVIRGTSDQINFVGETLRALERKVEAAREEARHAQKLATDGAKTGADAPK